MCYVLPFAMSLVVFRYLMRRSASFWFVLCIMQLCVADIYRILILCSETPINKKEM